MKRYGGLWDKIITKDNILLAFKRASAGKSKFTSVQKFKANLDVNICKVQDILINKEYKHSKYNEKIIFEPKQRTIYVLPFYPDRIIQHALMNILEPIWEKLFIHHSYACIKNKGIHIGSKVTTQFVKRNRYCLKLDISKFYPSIVQSIMFDIIKRKIKCENTLWLISKILTSFEGDKNVPIGNYTSQWFGNLYMNEVDQFVKHILGCKDYIRYCDDFLLFSDNKKYLNSCSCSITEYLDTFLKLKLSKCTLFPTSRGVDFLGYRHFSTYTLLRKSTAKRVQKRFSTLIEDVKRGEVSKEKATGQIASAYGWIKHADAYNFKKKINLIGIKDELAKI